MNPDLDLLQPYPFEKLNKLKSEVEPNDQLDHIALSIGEPKHNMPSFAREALISHIDKVSNYPTTKGLPELRISISEWAINRFQLESLDTETQILPVNGTREALFAFTQAVIDKNSTHKAAVLMPNPFYQIYEGACLLAGAEPIYLNCLKENNYLPVLEEVDEQTWQRCQLFFICTPGNPTGAICDSAYFKKLITLSDKYNFIIASDECYSELYFDESKPPIGLLQACAEIGRSDYKNCVVFHSLSKRSNLPGMRSGFCAGDATVLENFLKYRTYHGCAMPIQHQLTSIAAWQNEEHVKENRVLYREKFNLFKKILDDTMEITIPPASFYLWPKVPTSATIKNEQDFAKALFAKQNITVLPGSFLGRNSCGINPGSGHIRMALVATVEECTQAAQRIKDFIETM